MAKAHEPITVAGPGRRARMSRCCLYTQPEILTRIEQLHSEHNRMSTTGPRPDTRASMESLLRRLELAHQHNTSRNYGPKTTSSAMNSPRLMVNAGGCLRSARLIAMSSVSAAERNGGLRRIR
jgi:hypothetical protein